MALGRCAGFCSVVVCYLSAGRYASPYLWMAVCRLVSCQIPEGCDVAPESSNDTGLEVILPSVGQTGTSSVSEALSDMGYRSYHVEERSLYARETMMDIRDPSKFARSASRCRIEALALEPGTEVYPLVLPISPSAKVVLTWRAYPSWQVSTTTGGVTKDRVWGKLVGMLGSSINFLPWGFLLEALTGEVSRVLRAGEPYAGKGQASVMQVMLKTTIGGRTYAHPLANTYQRGVFKVAAQEEAYLAHINEIRVLTPPDRLLEFDIKKHGWAELGSFLGRPTPSGTPFPHPRSKDSWTNDSIFDHNMPAYLTCLAIYAVLHGANLLIVGGFLRGVWALLAVLLALLRPLLRPGRSKAD